MNSRVHGTEVTLDAANLLFKDLVPEPRLELTLPQRGSRDAHRILPTTKENVRLAGGDRGAVQRCLSDVRFEHSECPGLVYLM